MGRFKMSKFTRAETWCAGELKGKNCVLLRSGGLFFAGHLVFLFGVLVFLLVFELELLVAEDGAHDAGIVSEVHAVLLALVAVTPQHQRLEFAVG